MIQKPFDIPPPILDENGNTVSFRQRFSAKPEWMSLESCVREHYSEHAIARAKRAFKRARIEWPTKEQVVFDLGAQEMIRALREFARMSTSIDTLNDAIIAGSESIGCAAAKFQRRMNERLGGER